MASLEKANVESPHTTWDFVAHGHMDEFTLGGLTLRRATFEPGWRWSEDVGPIVGADSCPAGHVGICLSGQVTVRALDGLELTFGPGDIFVMEPGHDAWTVGSEPCEWFDAGAAITAKFP